ncbi:hypothetical protein Mapa_013889 [Marchantia paleacea]|nr:hypothetical protein Mapa_013889 [Marchantia paleacea]
MSNFLITSDHISFTDRSKCSPLQKSQMSSDIVDSCLCSCTYERNRSVLTDRLIQ